MQFSDARLLYRPIQDGVASVAIFIEPELVS